MLVAHSLVAAGAMAFVIVGIVAAGWSPHVAYVVGLTVLAVPASIAVRRTGLLTWRSSWPAPALSDEPPVGVDPRLGTLVSMLRYGVEDASAADHRLRPLLAEIAEHRLRRDHDVDLHADDERARQLLGDDTVDVLTLNDPGPLDPQRLERVIGAIEHV